MSCSLIVRAKNQREERAFLIEFSPPYGYNTDNAATLQAVAIKMFKTFCHRDGE